MEVRFEILVFGFKTWFFLVSLLLVTMYVKYFDPPVWVSGSFVWACVVTVVTLDHLGLKGKKNYEKLGKETTTEP